MSFKREGDDKNLLKNLNFKMPVLLSDNWDNLLQTADRLEKDFQIQSETCKCVYQPSLVKVKETACDTKKDQRVKELLGNHIPQDEAKLLSNGRLTCTICLHRPIFDTINMLANHRKGKRHISELSKFIKCKEEAERKAMLRKRDLPSDTLYKIAKSDCFTSNRSSSLGCKHVEAKKSQLKHRRKPILEVRLTKSKLPDSSSQEKPEKKALTTVRHYLKKMTRETSLEKVVEKNREHYGVDLQKDCSGSSLQKCLSSHQPNFPLPKETTGSRTADMQEYELKLRMSGWIKDESGKWIKDPNVEFDSDEEETPPPPP